MSMSDTFGDFITRVRNAYIAGSDSVIVPGYKTNLSVLKIMENEGFIVSYMRIDDNTDFTVVPTSGSSKSKVFRPVKVMLRYTNFTPALMSVVRVSKPSRRVYSGISDLGVVYNGFGIYILTTTKGVLTDHQAREQRVGGEILCYMF